MTKIFLIAITAAVIGLAFYLPQLTYLDHVNKSKEIRAEIKEEVKEFVAITQTYERKKKQFALPRKMTKLHHDAAFAEVDDIDETLLIGRHINIQNAQGHTALHIAAFKGRLDMVKLLLLWRADPNIKDDNGDKPYDLVMRIPANNELLDLLRHVTIDEEAESEDEDNEENDEDEEDN